MKLIKEQAQTLARTASAESTLLNGKMNDVTKINSIIATGIALKIAFKILDVPTAKDTIHRQYYNDNLLSIVDETVSVINEIMLIDYKMVKELTYKMWFNRVALVQGQMPEKLLLDFLEDSPMLSKLEQEACDDRVDCLLKAGDCKKG